MPLSIVYHKNVIEFVTVAKEYIGFLEELTGEETKAELLGTLQKLLPLLYLKAALLPETEFQNENEPVDKFCTEEYYNQIQNTIKSILRFNDEECLLNASSQEIDRQEWVFVSELLADIFQSLYDFIYAYRIGSEDLMHDALTECVVDFKTMWGSRLLVVLETIHSLLYGHRLKEDDADEYRTKQDGEDIDTTDWIINKIRKED